MPDYTPLGIDKIVQQAKADLALIRCPRDSAVMRVLAYEAIEEGDTMAPRSATAIENRIVTSVDVECPACRRRAMHAILVDEPPETMNAQAPAAL